MVLGEMWQTFLPIPKDLKNLAFMRLSDPIGRIHAIKFSISTYSQALKQMLLLLGRLQIWLNAAFLPKRKLQKQMTAFFAYPQASRT